MTLFEYLAIAFGLLYSVAALRVLGGLPVALAQSRRYSLHLTLTVINLLLIATSFWTFWSLRDVEWTFPGFLLALLVPGLLTTVRRCLCLRTPRTSFPGATTISRRIAGGTAALACGALPPP
jgi:hypothetical protein